MLYTVGNKKIGKDTVIINLCSATDCPAQGMCLLRTTCYALSHERIRKNVRPFRDRQEMVWRNNPAEYYIDYLKKLKNGFLHYVRFQESGDFATQGDVDKMSAIAEGVKGLYRCYTYTNRHDLCYDNKSDNLVITGSYFMVDNMFLPFNQKAYDMLPEGSVRCKGDCRDCTLCKEARGINIYQLIH